jgi:hypothetical protein
MNPLEVRDSRQTERLNGTQKLRAMQRKMRTIMIVVFAQYGAIALGMCWGHLELQHSYLSPPGYFAGATSFVAFGIEALRFLITTRSTATRRRTSCVCLGLLLYCGFVMSADPFLNHDIDRDFIPSMVLLMPFLLAINSLARSGAWLAIVASVIFFATSIAMLMHNAACRGGATGFFSAYVY